MALTYVEFATTPTNFLSDLNAQLAAATDWSRPNSSARPYTWKCTTTRGADMVIDFNGAAPTYNGGAVFQAYSSYDGTTLGVAAPTKYMRPVANNAGANATQVWHVVLSISKEHIYLEIEGPRYNEVGTDGQYGSIRYAFAMCDLVPYLSSTYDPTPTVVLIGSSVNSYHQGNQATNNLIYKVHVSRNAAGTLNWSRGSLVTLDHPITGANGASASNFQRNTVDGNVYLSPYVFADDSDGVRGRLSSFFHAGYGAMNMGDGLIDPLASNSLVTYNSQKYRLRLPYRHNGLTTSTMIAGAFGAVLNGGAPANAYSPQDGPLVAVPVP